MPQILLYDPNITCNMWCIQKTEGSRCSWFRPPIPALGTLNQECQKFEASLGYVVRPCLLLYPLTPKTARAARIVCSPVPIERQKVQNCEESQAEQCKPLPRRRLGSPEA